MAETIRPQRVNARCEIPSTQVVLKHGNELFLGFARNISRAGIFMHTVRPCRVGEEFHVEFTVPHLDINVKCRSKVAWSKNPTWIREGISSEGLTFVDIDPQISDMLDGWIKEQAF
jgi:Tfp pilus assembly protein PilZ